jgi:hypothetical protein
MDSNTELNFPFYDTHIEFFILNFLCWYQYFLLTLKPKSDETTQKKEKRMCARIPFHINLRARRLHFVKKVKLLYPATCLPAVDAFQLCYLGRLRTLS